MNVLWIGLSVFAFIISIIIVAAITRGAFFWLRGRSGPLHSNWAPMQVCSGDDSLGHPDLKKISELQDSKRVI